MPPVFVIADTAGKAKVTSPKVEVIDIVSLAAEDPGSHEPVRLPVEQHIASLMFTSGTTGKPKAAPYTHANHLWNVTLSTKIWNWTADDTFLDLIRDRVAVNAMLDEVAGKAVADANLSETAKIQKKIIQDCLTGEGRDKVEGWVPRYMAFPPGHYDPNKTLQMAADWEAIKPLFTGE